MPVADMNSLFQLDWDIAQASQNTSANTSRVYGRLIVRRKSTSAGGYWTNTPRSWSASINGQNFSGTWTYNFNNYMELMLWQGEITVAHNADGTKSVASSGYAHMDPPAGSATVNRTITLSTIPRASKSTFSAAPVTNTATTINTNRASSSFTHDLTYHFGNTSGTIATGVATSVSWTPPRSLLQQIKSAATGSGHIQTVTKNGSTVIGTTTTPFTLTADSAARPTLSDLTLSEATAAVLATPAVGAYVQDQSQLKYTFTGAVGFEGSTVTQYTLTVAGTVYSSATAPVNQVTGTIAASGQVTVTAVVRDSRGRESVPVTKTITVLPWSPPEITDYTTTRALADGTAKADGTYIKVTMTAVVANLTVGGSQKNKIGQTTATSPSGADTFVNKKTDADSAVTTLTTSFVIGSYAQDSSFDVRTTLRDRFTTALILRTIPVAAIALDLGEVNAGVGKFWQRGTLDIGGPTYISDNLALHAGIVLRGTLAASYRGGTFATVKINDTGEVVTARWSGTYVPWNGREVTLIKLNDEWTIFNQADPEIFYPQMASPWVDYNYRHSTSVFRPARATKLSSGLVVLSGLIKRDATSGPATGEVIFTLPAGWRPDYQVIVPTLNGSAPRALTINPNGTVAARAGISTDFVSLDGIAFWPAGTADWTLIGQGGSSFAGPGQKHSSWQTTGDPAFYRDPYGFTWLRGLVSVSTATTADNTVVINLPSGYGGISGLASHFFTAGNDGAAIAGTQEATGNLTWKVGSPTAAGAWISLNGIAIATASSASLSPWWPIVDWNGGGNREGNFTEPQYTRREDGLCMLQGLTNVAAYSSDFNFVMSRREMWISDGRGLFVSAASASWGRVAIAGVEEYESIRRKGGVSYEGGGLAANWLSLDSIYYVP